MIPSIMGVTYVTTKIESPTRRGKAYSAEFLVEKGAIDCMAPESSLKAAGVKSEGKAVYEMADGRPVEMQYGFARVSFVGADTVAQVIFGPEDASHCSVWLHLRTPESRLTRARGRCAGSMPSL